MAHSTRPDESSGDPRLRLVPPLDEGSAAPAVKPELSDVDDPADPEAGISPSVLELVEEPLPDLLGSYEVEPEDVAAEQNAEASGEAVGPASVPAQVPAVPGSTPQAAPAQRSGPTVHVGKAAPRHGSPRTQVGEEQAADKRKARKGAAFMGILFLVYLAWIVVSGQLDEFTASLATADYGWLALGLLFMGVRFGFGTLAYVFAVYIDPTSPVGVRDCMSVEASGTLFGNLTPMNSGAVPAQIYRLTRAGLTVGEASATQFTRFIFYQAGEVVVAAVLLWLKFDFFIEHYGNFVILNLVVFVIQTLQAVALLFVCIFPRIVVRGGNWGIRFAQRHGWIKPEAAQRYLHVVNVQVAEFSATFKESFKHKASLFLTWLVTLGMLVCFYSVPWCVLKAFGGDADFVECLAAGAMVQMIGNSVPLPGGAGGNEAGFAFFFGPIFGAAATAGFVVWRLITFFIPTAVCLPLSALRSTSRRSIYQRWNSFRRNGSRRATYTFKG